MKARFRKVAAAAIAIALAGCGKDDGRDAEVTTRGEIEVTARLIEVPPKAVEIRDLYNYAGVLKYQVVSVHRGDLKATTIYVAHYNPYKPRSEAADRIVKNVGGNLTTFVAGDLHRMALAPIDDVFMGGQINPYIDEKPDPIYFALWTNRVR